MVRPSRTDEVRRLVANAFAMCEGKGFEQVKPALKVAMKRLQDLAESERTKRRFRPAYDGGSASFKNPAAALKSIEYMMDEEARKLQKKGDEKLMNG